jgi:hypothetical protein
MNLTLPNWAVPFANKHELKRPHGVMKQWYSRSSTFVNCSYLSLNLEDNPHPLSTCGTLVQRRPEHWDCLPTLFIDRRHPFPLTILLHLRLRRHFTQLFQYIQLRKVPILRQSQHLLRQRMETLLPSLHIPKPATFTINQLAMSLLIRHEQRDRTSHNICRLVIILTESSDDASGYDTRVCPRGRNGIDAYGQSGIELGAQRA